MSDGEKQLVDRLNYPTIQDRAWLFLVYAVGSYTLHGALSGQWLPTGTQSGLWFVSVVGLLAFRLLASPFFARPKDTFVAALTGTFVLWSLDLSASEHQALLDPVRWVGAGALALITLSGFLAVILGRSDPTVASTRSAVARWSYHASAEFGKGEVVFTPSALIGAFGFALSSTAAITLASTWILLAVAQPLERLLRVYRRQAAENKLRATTDHVGLIQRTDDPGIVRVALSAPHHWTKDKVLLAKLADGRCVRVLPLFTHVRDSDTVGTGLFSDAGGEVAIPHGVVVADADPPDRASVLASIGGVDGPLVGYVVEGSTIGAIQFEVATDRGLEEGEVVFCKVADNTVAYQITEARTTEESFESNPRGTVVVTATQLGIRDIASGFKRCLWTPSMNTPVYMSDVEQPTRPDDRFTYGKVPGTGDWIEGRFSELAEFHGAVLGSTGMGKTELVFDIIREGLSKGAKIACVDFTEEYSARLADHDPQTLGFSQERCAELAGIVESIETGDFGGATEKAALNQFVQNVTPEVTQQVEGFLGADGPGLGIFELEDIANTRSTLRATEMYLSQIFAWAKRNRKARQILVVLEEAHTVIPETNLFGYDRVDTLAVLGRISQIALQGRKYGVGLLVVSQRTALVSKTILSQCGTVASFALVDKTSLDYLRSVFDDSHCRAIPRFPTRRLVVAGPAVVADGPIILDVPFDQAKADASAALAVD